MKGMGFENSQYVLVRHRDAEHDHCHIIANRIDMNGQVVSDSRDYARSAQVCKELEQKYSLVQAARRPHEADQKAMTKGQGKELERTGQAPVMTRLQEMIKEASRDRPDMSRFIGRLEESGVNVRCNVQSTGRIAGISYELDGVAIKGSQLGKAYSWDGLQKQHGVTYEQSRDLASCRAATERGRTHTTERPDGLSHEISRDHGGEHRQTERGIERSVERPDGNEREHPAAAERGRERIPKDHSRTGQYDEADAIIRERFREAPRPHDERDTAPDLAAGDLHRDCERRADRVADLAMVEPAAGRTRERLPGRDESHHRGDEPAIHHHPKDYTAEAVRAQVRAFGGDRFEIGIREENTGRMMNRSWNREELEKAVPWLKRMNATGNHIYIRPAPQENGHTRGLVLVDDLKRTAIREMEREGLEPAMVLETSQGNFQAWVKLADSLTRDEAKEAARQLADKYQGDRSSADGLHYGRMAGFTNQKEKYGPAGERPYVRLEQPGGQVASRAREFLEQVREKVAEHESQRRAEQIRTYTPSQTSHGSGPQMRNTGTRLGRS